MVNSTWYPTALSGTMCLPVQQWQNCYGGNQLLHLRLAPCEEIHVWYYKGSQKPVAMEADYPRREATIILLNNHVMPIKLTSIYVFIHRLVLASAFVKEASFCNVWQLEQRLVTSQSAKNEWLLWDSIYPPPRHREHWGR